jgi:hypothetical protein
MLAVPSPGIVCECASNKPFEPDLSVTAITIGSPKFRFQRLFI